ncbi:hypothetical protein AAF712_006084 [Marasmius tenuissimus]|uniref:Zn(2)-C6 fungal-type domain-containing protein n=1 Tax=Marasmius tenuissimus TaxID=585030 RepID=A0ABR3A0H8_9AGAR
MAMEVPASAPQIRSRITVVCAECKRLKLKCDRRNPCGSCQKRDTVSRCIYSAAAAEKVDLHSLNNRLIQVETMLAQVTAGQFQPSYPFISPNSATNPTPSSSGTQHPTSTAPTSCQISRSNAKHASIAIPLDDLTTTWLHDINVRHSSYTSNHKRMKPSTSEVKLEPTPIPLSQLNINSKPNKTPVQLTLPPTSAYYAPSGDALATTFPRVTKELLARLPPQQYSHSPRHHPHGQSYPSSSPPHAPPVYTLDRILGLAEQALTDTHPWMNWKVFRERAQAFVSRRETRDNVNPDGQDPEKERQREQKERERERALQIFGMSHLQSQSLSSSHPMLGKKSGRVSAPFISNSKDGDTRRQSIDIDMDVDPGGQKNVPFFAWLCIAIAIGMVEAGKETLYHSGPQGDDMMDIDSHHPVHLYPPVLEYANSTFRSSDDATASRAPAPDTNVAMRTDPAYWYHLSLQAVHVWESDRQTYQDSDDEASAEIEEMEMDHFSALLLQLVYLVRVGLPSCDEVESDDANDEPQTDESSKKKHMQTVTGKVAVPLMGKLVALARQMMLHIDPEDSLECSSDGPIRRKDKDRDGTGKFKEKDRERESGNMGNSRRRPFTLFQGEMRRRVWWTLMYYDLLVSDISALPPLLPLTGDSFSTKLPVFNVDDRQFSPSSLRIPPPEEGGHDGQSWSKHAMRGLQVKCEVVKIVRAIKARINSPRFGVGMSPGPGGYSIEQAALMEGEVRSWMGSLPSFWKVSVPNTYIDEEEDIDELVEDGQEPRREEVHEVEVVPQENEDPLLTAQRCELAIMAHRLVLRIYLPFLQPPRKGSNSYTPVPHQANLGSVNAAHGIIAACKVLFNQRCVQPSSLFDFYPFIRTVFDAAVICGHAAVKQPLSILMKPALEDVDLALGMLKKCAMDPFAPGLLSEEYILPPREAVQIVERLRRKVGAGGDDGLFNGFPITSSASPRSEGHSPSLKRKHGDDDSDESDGEGDIAQHPLVTTVALPPPTTDTSSMYPPSSSTTRVVPAYVYPTIHPSDGTSSSSTNSPITATSATSTTSVGSFHQTNEPTIPANGNVNPHNMGGEPVYASPPVDLDRRDEYVPPTRPPTASNRPNASKSPVHLEKDYKKPSTKKPSHGIRVRNPKEAVASKLVTPPFTRTPQQPQQQHTHPTPHPPFQPPAMSATQEQHQQAYRSRSSSLSQPFNHGHTHVPLMVKKETTSIQEVTSYREAQDAHGSPNPSALPQRSSAGDIYGRRGSVHYPSTPTSASTPPQHQQPSQPPFSSPSAYDPRTQPYHAHQPPVSHPTRKETFEGVYAASYANGNSLPNTPPNPPFNPPAVTGGTYNGTSAPFSTTAGSSPVQGYYVPGYHTDNNSRGESSGPPDTMVSGNPHSGYSDGTQYEQIMYDVKPTPVGVPEYRPHPGYHDPPNTSQPSPSSSSLMQATQPIMTPQTWASAGNGHYWNGGNPDWGSS